MTKLNSLSLFVGTGKCNANCKHCAGIPLRKYAPKEDGIIDEKLISKTITECYNNGARYLSISSSGEPTLSPIAVTKTLKLIDNYKNDGIKFNPINLYSNGIRIGKDKEFCDTYLPLWKNLGLTTLYITIHDINENDNAKIYGIENYPSIKTIVSRLHDNYLLMRANIVLSKRTISTLEEFVNTTNYLKNIGVDSISAWPIRDINDKIDLELSPLETELDKIESWIDNSNLKNNVKLLRENSKIAYTSGQKLTLFPDGTLSNTWCNR
ncbi:MAG: radical SAM protein [Candidatus Woesearchaeota archaeon]